MKAMKNLTSPALLAAVFSLFQGVPFAQSSTAGTSPFEFLELRYDARSIALGGASTALADDAYGIFSNPAAIAYAASPQAVVGYRSFDGVYGIPLAYIRPENDKGVFGIGVCGLTSGNISPTGIDNSGAAVSLGGNAYLDDYSLSLAWARKIGDFLSAGVTAKAIYELFNEDGAAVQTVDGSENGSTFGIALDAGCQARFMNSRLIYGFALRNLGGVLSGYDKGLPLPVEFAAGVSYVPASVPVLRLMIDADKERDNELTFEPGGEWEIIKNQLFARAGYSFSWSDLQALEDYLSGAGESGYTRNSMTGFCCGAGLKSAIAGRKVSFDAAVEFLTIAASPNISLSMLVEM